MKTDQTIAARRKRDDRTFVSMAATYSMGVFNDNFFKQSALLIALGLGLTHIQGTATVYFALPFILFSAWAGWLADRFPKKTVVVNGKILELIAMFIGAVGLITTNWPCILSMVFLMGLQSAIFGPALNGSIPEHFGESEIMKINGTLKMATTIAILVGIASAGLVLDIPVNSAGLFAITTGQVLVAIIVLAVAAAGLIASLGIDKHRAADPSRPFPWSGPFESVSKFWSLRQDPQLFLAICSNAFFYFLATLVVLIINSLGIVQLGLSQTTTSLLSVALMVGVAGGSIYSAGKDCRSNWQEVLLPGAAGMGCGLAAAALLSPVAASHPVLLFISLATTGFCGGMFLIPINSFIQIRPDEKEKGRILGTSGFCSFVGILLAGQAYNLMDLFLVPSAMMAASGLLSLALALVYHRISPATRPRLREKILRLAMRAILRLRYKIEIKGLEKISPAPENESILFLPNHPAIVDPVILMSILHKPFRPRPLADRQQIDRFYLRPVMNLVNTIRIPNAKDFKRADLKHIATAIDKVVDALRQGDNVLLYPAGRLYRSENEELGANSGVKTILARLPHQRIVLVRTGGLWGSSFSWAGGKAPTPLANWKSALKFLIANAIFFGPRRKITVEFAEAADLPRTGDKLTINRFLEEFYNQASRPNTRIPLYWWQGGKEIVEAEPSWRQGDDGLEHIPQSVKKEVLDHIAEAAGVEEVAVADKLAADIGMDSLAIMDLAAWLETEYGLQLNNIESLQTAGDCILAACRQSGGPDWERFSNVPAKWFADKEKGQKLELSQKGSIAHSMLDKARKNPDRAIVADQMSGVKTYRQFIMGAMVLKSRFAALEDERLGIMLPATVAAATSYFGVMFSGKTPVMLNWTIGVKPLRHCLETTGTKVVITSRALLNKLGEQGMDFSALDVTWLCLEDLRKEISLPAKLMALAKSYLSWRELQCAKTTETAAILFTSGSENLPKAVPLSHANILANIRDFSSVLEFSNTDRLLGMLPPFHSLGLAGNIIMPLCLGLKTTYHANPTESAVLAKLVEKYQATLLIGTPTFLSGILRASRPGKLSSLRLLFTGAEKCPDHVYRQAAELVSEAVLCEGYGITECSPVVAVNTPINPYPGTIGRVLPGMEFLIVDPERKTPVENQKKGLLLVRGENVFTGYLGREAKSPFIEVNGKEWYDTGDLVSMDQKGVLTFQGRLKRFIKLGGEMISLPAIETVLQKMAPTREDGKPSLAVEATPDEIHPELVLFSTFPVDRKEINRCLQQAGLSALHNIRRHIELEEIPVLGTGKTDYRKLKAAFALE